MPLDQRLADSDVTSPREHGPHQQAVGEHHRADFDGRAGTAIPEVADPDHDNSRDAGQDAPEPPQVGSLQFHRPGQQQNNQRAGCVKDPDVRGWPQSGRAEKKPLVDRHAKRRRKEQKPQILANQSA